MREPSTGLIPERLLLEGGEARVRWIPSDGARFTEPFFEDTLRRLRRLRSCGRNGEVVTDVDVWDRPAPAPRPDGVVFHVSRCGSTLLSRMLATLPGSVVISEAPVIDDIVRAHHCDERIGRDRRIAWLREAVAALAEAVDGSPERLFIKLDCWHLFELELIRSAFPDTPLLFVYRHPLEVLVSLMRVPSLLLVRDTVTPAQLGMTATERDALSREELVAATLGAFYRTATGHRAHVIPVAYDALPDFVWTAMPGCSFSPGDIEALREASKRDAKDPRRTFTPDGADKRREADPTVRAASERWAEPEYRRWFAAL